MERDPRSPARPLRVWLVFLVIVLGAVWLTGSSARAGQGPLGFFALAVIIATFGPRLQALWQRIR